MFARLKPIWTLTAGHRARYGAAIVALLLATCFLYLAPLIPQIIIDGVLLADGETPESRLTVWGVRLLGGREFLAGNLWWPALLMVVLTSIAGLFTFARGRWSATASEGIVRSVRDGAYDHLQHLPCSYFDTAQSGDLIQRCTSDVETLRTFLSTQVVEIGRAAIMLLVPIPLMLLIDVRMTVMALVLIPFILGFSLIYFRRIRAAFKAMDEAEGQLSTVIQENLTGIRVVRAFARQEFEQEKLASVNRTQRDLEYRLFVELSRFWSGSDLLCFGQKGLVVGVGAYLLATGRLQVGAYYFFLTAATMYIWPVRMMGRILADLGKATVALGRLQEIFQVERESDLELPAPIDSSRRGAELAGGIVFDRVSFSHDESSPVLRDVSFSAEPGETLAVLGPSGCGKSTVVNLLLRLYDYDKGSIRLDGHELRTLGRKLVRSQMAVVLQEPFLYSKSLRENLTLVHGSASEEQMIEAASTACVHESILRFAEGYDTLVGERGVTLSGGQRQRVALARALLQDPAILVLDDALSAVDSETEAMILRALRERHGRHTTIVIAHRLATLMHADRIVVLDHGRVVQSGTHEELLRVEGLYRRLWMLQGGELDPSDAPSREDRPRAIGVDR